jgi:beta-phosphoglucomutase
MVEAVMQERAIILDKCGVVVLLDHQNMEASCQALENVVGQRPVVPKGYRGGKSRSETIRYFLGLISHEASPHLVAEIVREKNRIFYEMISHEGIEYVPGVVEFMRTARSWGYRLGLATSSSRQNTEFQDRIAPFLKYFDGCVCGDEVAREKPAPDLFFQLSKTLGVPDTNCVLIEDSPIGVQAGLAWDGKVVGLTTVYGTEALQGAHLVVNSFNDLTKHTLEHLLST